jgi:hypothetical protein
VPSDFHWFRLKKEALSREYFLDAAVIAAVRKWIAPAGDDIWNDSVL